MTAVVVPDSIEPVVGWKAFDLGVGNDLELRSPTMGTPWPAGEEMVAKCEQSSMFTPILSAVAMVPGRITYAASANLHGATYVRTGWNPAGFTRSPAAAAQWKLCRVRDDVEGLRHQQDGMPLKPAMVPPPGLEWVFVVGPAPELGPAPHEGHGCGIYAAHLEIAAGYGHETHFGERIFGQVALWGKVVPGTNGYRGEKAYPQRLFVVGGHARKRSKMVARLGERYGVPCERVSKLRDLAELEKVGT